MTLILKSHQRFNSKHKQFSQSRQHRDDICATANDTDDDVASTV